MSNINDIHSAGRSTCGIFTIIDMKGSAYLW